MYWQSSVPSIHFSSSHSCQTITFLVLSKLQLTIQITHHLKTREKIIIFLSSGFSQLGDFSSCQETLAILPSMPKRHLETKHHVCEWLDHWAWTKVGCQKFLCLTVQSKEELRTCHMTDTDTGVLSIFSIAFWCKWCKLKPLVYNMNVWGFPKVIKRGLFCKVSWGNKVYSTWKIVKIILVKLCFSFFFFSNLLSCLLKQRYKHVCMWVIIDGILKRIKSTKQNRLHLLINA